MRARLGQFSWNSAMQAPMQAFSWNSYGQSPQERLLTQAAESMQAPRPATPQQNLLRQAAESIGADCYTCANGGDIRSGVDAATAAQLKSQGFRCRKDECAQKAPAYAGYGMGPSGFQSYGNLMTSQGSTAQGLTDFGSKPSGASSFASMMGPLKAAPLNQGRF